jgi:hypothetical protein
MAKRKKPSLMTLRLRTELCGECQKQPLDQKCLSIISCQNPRCHERFTHEQLDLWEVYDKCAICPACEVPMPSYDCFTICRLELKTQQELFT